MNNSSADRSFDMEQLPMLPTECSSRTAALWGGNILLAAGLEREWDLREVRHTLFVMAVIATCPRDMSEAAILAEVQETVRNVLTNRSHATSAKN